MSEYAIAIQFVKHKGSVIQNKLRLFIVEANSVDEAVGKVMNNKLSDEVEGFSISTWQACKVEVE